MLLKLVADKAFLSEFDWLRFESDIAENLVYNGFIVFIKEKCVPRSNIQMIEEDPYAHKVPQFKNEPPI